MSKAVMLSIHPKWCEKIVNGNKTIEVRKTRPKLDTPFKCYIYCTSGKTVRTPQKPYCKNIDGSIMTDAPLPECLACLYFVDKAQDDLEAFYGRADND